MRFVDRTEEMARLDRLVALTSKARSDRASTRWCSTPSVRFTASRTVC